MLGLLLLQTRPRESSCHSGAFRARGGCEYATSRACRYCNIERLPDDFVALVKKHNPRIIELDLTSNQISELPDDLHELTHLQALRVKYNRLEFVPPVCFKIQRLVTLDLAGNHIEAVPDDIVRLSALRELDVSGNHITSLTGMPSVHSLQLAAATQPQL